MQDFSGRVALITGGASGVGFGQAELFGKLGCRIAIVDVRQDALDAAQARLAEMGVEAFAMQLDIRDRAAWEVAVDAVEAHFASPVTLLFNTAGVNGFGELERASYADFDWIMGVNFNGVVNGIMTVLPRMLAAGQGGHIAAVASMAGFEGSRVAGIYAASKAAVINLMESYALTLPAQGIGVSVVCPASVRTGIAKTLESRPAELAAGSSFNASPEFVALQDEFYQGGMEPVELAGHLRDAIAEDRFWVLPFTETRAGLSHHFDTVLAGYDAYDAESDAAKARAEALLAYRERAAALRD